MQNKLQVFPASHFLKQKFSWVSLKYLFKKKNKEMNFFKCTACWTGVFIWTRTYIFLKDGKNESSGIIFGRLAFNGTKLYFKNCFQNLLIYASWVGRETRIKEFIPYYVTDILISFGFQWVMNGLNASQDLNPVSVFEPEVWNRSPLFWNV